MRHKLSDAERALFRTAMKDVKPLTKNTIAPFIKRHKFKVGKIKQEEEIPQPIISDYEKETVSTDEIISFVRSGIQPNYFRKLQKGRLPIEAELDLHSLSVEQARTELLTFLQASVLRGIRVVRIIHGKGQREAKQKPLLKNKVNTWLRQLDNILAFSSAIPKDGGTGAVYVLLRNQELGLRK